MSAVLHKYKYLVFLIIAFVLYGNTIKNNYALDDNYVTETNITTKGLSSVYTIFTTHYDVGEDGKGYTYRPIVKLSYAIEHQVLGVSPHTSHFINILIYALCLILLYKALIIIFSDNNSTYVFFTVLIFACLPSHSEVVASLKNRDILLCYVFSLYAFVLFNRYLTLKKWYHLDLAILMLFTAFLSKLDVLPFLFLFPVVLLQKKHINIKTIVIVLVIAAVVYQGYKSFQGLMVDKNLAKRTLFYFENPLYFDKSVSLKLSTFLNSLGFYTKELLLPVNFSSYYGYDTIPVRSFTSLYALSGLATALVCLLALIKYYKTPQHPVFIGTLFFVSSISMYMNLVKSVPGIVADRFVFFASTGFVIVLMYYIFQLSVKTIGNISNKQSSAKYMPVIVVIFVICTALTVLRNKDWKNRLTLFSTDLKTYPRSVKLNVLYANELLTQVHNQKNGLSQAQVAGNIQTAKEHLQKAYAIDSGYYNISNTLGYIENQFFNNPQGALVHFRKSYAQQPYKFETALNVGLAYARLQNNDSAQHYLIKAYSIRPGDEKLKAYLFNYYKTLNKPWIYTRIYPD